MKPDTRIPISVPDPLELAAQLVCMDTSNPPGQEAEICAFLADLLERVGFDTALHLFAEGRTSLVASRNLREGVSPIAFTGHVDTVPFARNDWRHDPLCGEIRDGMLLGRGSCDMKGGLAALIAAAMETAAEPDCPGVALVITGGEETGNLGAQHLAELDLLPRVGALVVAEPTGMRPLLGHKGALWLRAHCAGKAAHGSMPQEGENAIHKAARALLRAAEYDFGGPQHPVLGGPTLNIGRVEGGKGINSVPDQASFTLDIRSVPGMDHESLIRALEGMMAPEIDRLEVVMDRQGFWTDKDTHWVGEVYGICSRLTGARMQPAGASYFTDGSVLAPAMGMPPTIILGPGKPEMCHKTDECCPVEEIHQARRVFAEMIRAWKGR